MVQNLEDNIQELWKEGRSVSLISTLTGTSRTKVYDVLKQAGLYEEKKKVPRKDAVALSRFHEILGHKISWERICIKRAKLNELAKEMGISAIRLSGIEAGLVDVTLSDLIKLSNLVETKPYLLLKYVSDELDKEQEVYTDIS